MRLLAILHLCPHLRKVAIEPVGWRIVSEVFGVMRALPQVRELRLKYGEIPQALANFRQQLEQLVLADHRHDADPPIITFPPDIRMIHPQKAVLRLFPRVKVLSLDLTELVSPWIDPNRAPEGIEVLRKSFEVLILYFHRPPSAERLARLPKLRSFIFRNPYDSP